MNYKALLSGTALSTLAIPAAFAADLPVRGPAPAPIFMSAPLSWSGFYVGLNAGVMHSSHKQDWFVTTPGCADNENNCGSATAFGGLAGLTAGYNFQSGNMVYGIEADIAGVFGNTRTENSAFFPQTRSQVNGFASLRARVGIANASTLFYLTGGFAAVNQKNSFLPASGYVGSRTNWSFAPVAGLGIEHQLGGGWTAKVEGLYVFETRNSVHDAVNGPKTYRTKSNHAIIRFGVNYRFGGGAAAPVVAKF